MVDSQASAAIRVQGVSKTFIPNSSAKTLKEGFVNVGRKLQGKREQTHHKGEYTALKDISFEVKKGEFFGIVGRNGSGKSTLLKILAGVYTPTKGSVQINGKLTPFIELGVGFNPELSGRDNVFLNGALLGFTRKQMEEMYDSIVEFAELEQFMDTKLKNYSSGMQVRLAFSVAIRAQSDILLIDEVLAVGDAAFQQKCFEYFGHLKKNHKTVVLVSHDMDSVVRFCSGAVLIENGIVVRRGSAAKVAMAYSKMFEPEQQKSLSKKNNKLLSAASEKNKYGVAVKSIKILQEGHPRQIVSPEKQIEVDIEIQSSMPNREGSIGINIINSQGMLITATTTRNLTDKLLIKKGTTRLVFFIDNIFANDTYYINLAIGIGDKSSGIVAYRAEELIVFQVKDRQRSSHGLTHPKTTLQIR